MMNPNYLKLCYCSNSQQQWQQPGWQMLPPMRSAETMQCWQGHVRHLCWIFNDQAFLITNWKTVNHIYRLWQVTYRLGVPVVRNSSNGFNFSGWCMWTTKHQYSAGVCMCANRCALTVHGNWICLITLWSCALNFATIPPTGLITVKLWVSAFCWEVEEHSNPATDTFPAFNWIKLWPAKCPDPTMSRRWQEETWQRWPPSYRVY